MYICKACSEEYKVELSTTMTFLGTGSCELHGHLKNRWNVAGHHWARYVRRPVFCKDPKKYILDQIEKYRKA